MASGLVDEVKKMKEDVEALRNAARGETTSEEDGERLEMVLEDLIERLNGAAVYSSAQMAELVAPELRLGRKLDINRAVGNLVDDNNNLVIDEPIETASPTVATRDGFDNDRDGSIDGQDPNGDAGEK